MNSDSGSSQGKVLIADDEENVVLTLEAVLQREGYEVYTATSVTEAQRLLEHGPPFEAALLDLRFGDIDGGLEILSQLNKLQPTCMAVILTGFASLESAIEAIRKGAYDYLIKPCDMEELKLTVARAVEHGVIARVLHDHIHDLEATNKELRILADDLRARLETRLADLHEQIRQATQRLSELNLPRS